MKFCIFICFFLQGLFSSAYGHVSDLSPELFKELSNLYDPTISDLQYIQEHLTNDERPILKRMGDKEFVARDFKIVGNTPKEKPERGFCAVNCSNEERENCIILYASFNERYPRGLRRLLRIIKNSDFIGHVHYRIGGWPNMSDGDLVLVGVPFAFKPCFFKEVEKMGYKRILWLDASILPAPKVSLNTIFETIRKKGYFIQGNSHYVGPFMNEEAANAFGISLKATNQIPSCSAAIIGIDFTNEKMSQVIDAWYRAAKDPDAFYSARSDQNALSIILYQKGIHKLVPITTLGCLGRRSDGALFIMDREYVKE